MIDGGIDVPEVGKRYGVKFDDCCVAGSFIATVVELLQEDEEAERYSTGVRFDNGVTLELINCCKFTEVE